MRHPDSNRVSDLLINKSSPVTLHDSSLTFCDTGKSFQLERNLLKMITNENYIVDLAKLSEEEIRYEFPTEKYFCGKRLG